jgi:hypothetical protein
MLIIIGGILFFIELSMEIQDQIHLEKCISMVVTISENGHKSYRFP